MSSLQLSWTNLFVSTTCLTPEEENEGTLQVLQWRTAGSTLQITRAADEQSFIDIRMDQDVQSVEYTFPDDEIKSAVVLLKLLASRPFPWAANTIFNADDSDNNEIVFEVALDDEEDCEKYRMLTIWLKSHQNKGGAATYLAGEGEDILQELMAGLTIQNAPLATIIDTVERPTTNPYGTLTADNIQRLKHGNWANDDVIEFGMKWARSQALEVNHQMNCYIYATQFYSVIHEKRAEKWFKRHPMHEYDFCVFPTNIDNKHWVLVIVDQAKYARRDPATLHGKSTAIYVLDSLSSDDTDTVALDFQRFVQDYYKTPDYTPHVASYIPKVPQQRNSFDCGFWTIHFCRMFASQPEEFRKLIRGHDPYEPTDCWKRRQGLQTRGILRKLAMGTSTEVDSEADVE